MRKYVHMVAFWGHHLLGTMLRKLAIFNARKYVHMEAFFGITYWEPMPDGVICIRSKIACL